MAIKSGQLIEHYGSLVEAETLPHHSSKRIICVCDNCGKEQSKIVKQYYSSLEKHGAYYCKECFNHDKRLLEIRNKQTKTTCIEKYGVDNPMKNSDIKDKLKTTINEKYKVDYAGQIVEGRKKRNETCLLKYGVENPVVLSDNTNCHSKTARIKATNTTRAYMEEWVLKLLKLEKKLASFY